MRLRDVKRFKGVMTGKTIKPVDDKSMVGFTKGDKVIVFHLEDFLIFYNAMDKAIHGTPEEIEQLDNKISSIKRK
ncbi:hypothetical protein [Methanobacterium formicicum]|uniref:Uncharacterized protein n=1 Tax=Methanobacterium formicicum (strain DSM 3637 / PP1) TaxID=1204725 RepID=K2R6R0_METFP|nr:hypothetical protein [Methanobacterium formicicum]EKF86847.1 hypothetical protein A994_01135 [Methanobacterium formicicum DSM 3637]